MSSRFNLFGRLDPADPFIARERSNVLPRLQRFYVGGQCLFQVRGQVMDHAARDLFCAQSFAHKFMARVASACHSCSFEWSYLSQQGKVAQARKDSGDRSNPLATNWTVFFSLLRQFRAFLVGV
jgi:hypothetical protein